MGPVLSIRGLTIDRGGRRLLTTADLTIGRGERWALVGPNGAGKSSLLMVLLGQLRATAGTITWHPDLMDRRRLAVIPQRIDLPVAVPTTVREYVALGTVGLGLSRPAAAQAIVEAIAGQGLAPDAIMSRLSGGQRQRAVIARALVRRPLLVVVDEPTTGLDPAAEEALFATVAGDAERTLIMVLHDLELVAAHASHVALISGGTLRAGPASQMLADPDLLAAYHHPLRKAAHV